jgi:hypothetical protein
VKAGSACSQPRWRTLIKDPDPCRLFCLILARRAPNSTADVVRNCAYRDQGPFFPAHSRPGLSHILSLWCGVWCNNCAELHNGPVSRSRENCTVTQVSRGPVAFLHFSFDAITLMWAGDETGKRAQSSAPIPSCVACAVSCHKDPTPARQDDGTEKLGPSPKELFPVRQLDL